MFLGGAEYDGLLHTSGAFEIFGDLRGDLVRAILQEKRIIKIAVGVNAVFNFLPINIALTLARPPAFPDICADIDDLVGREKSVLDSFAKGIGVNRFTEVVDIGHILCFFWRCGHADLRRGGKIIQNFAPTAVLLGGTAMTLVYNNQVEEIRSEEP